LEGAVYFHRELLGYSKEKRFVELITITGKNGVNDERDSRIEGKGLFPSLSGNKEAKELFSGERCFTCAKPTVFLTARVHPGEV
jgi:hypothetical protein